MARLIYTEQALQDLERLTDFLHETRRESALETVDLIQEAVMLLERHPLVGRPAENGMRELVISRGRTGYLALYAFDEVNDVILILAIRHQRETGWLSS